MRKLNLDAALEAIDAVGDDVAAFVAAAESLDKDADIVYLASNAQHEIASSVESINECFATVDRLVNMHSIISEYGISKPMMCMADPESELVAAGICGSYESLSVAPEKGESADAVLEGLSDVIKTVTKKISALVRSVKLKIKDFGIHWNKMISKYNSEVSKALVIIKDLNIDEEAFAKSSVNVLRKESFDNVVGSLNHLYKSIDTELLSTILDDIAILLTTSNVTPESMTSIVVKLSNLFSGKDLVNDKDMLNALGIMLIQPTKTSYGIRYGRRLSSSRQEVSQSGWDSASLLPAIEDVLKLLVLNRELFKVANVMDSIMDGILDINTTYVTETDEATDETSTLTIQTHDRMTLFAVNSVQTISGMLMAAATSVSEISATVVLLTAAASKAS